MHFSTLNKTSINVDCMDLIQGFNKLYTHKYLENTDLALNSRPGLIICLKCRVALPKTRVKNHREEKHGWSPETTEAVGLFLREFAHQISIERIRRTSTSLWRLTYCWQLPWMLSLCVCMSGQANQSTHQKLYICSTPRQQNRSKCYTQAEHFSTDIFRTKQSKLVSSDPHQRCTKSINHDTRHSTTYSQRLCKDYAK